jgi:hypothetical protein
MLAMLMSVTAMAADVKTSDNEEVSGDFVYEKGTNKIVAYIGDTGICEIPEDTEVVKLYDRSLSTTPITKLVVNKNVKFDIVLSGELQDFASLKEVVFEDGTEEIPSQSFELCKALEKVTIPQSVTTIGDYAFSDCKALKTIDLSDGLTSIGEYAFSNLPSLSGNITIPDTVTSMGANAFEKCGDLDKVHLSDNLTYEPTKNYNGSESFAGWFSGTQIGEINIPKAMLDNPTCYFSADEITFDSDMTVNIYNAVKSSSWCINKYLKGKTSKSLGGYDGFAIAENTVLKYIGTNKNPTVPNGVKVIGSDAFRYCDVDTVTLPDTVTEIEENAFYWSTIKSIEIPKSVKSIGDNAFDSCPLLEKITFDSSPEIGSNAVTLTNALTEDNIVFKNDDNKAKQEILGNGISEMSLTTFYNTLNKNRKNLRMSEVEVPKDAAADVSEQPQSTETPQSTDKPQETTAPQTTDAPIDNTTHEKLTVQSSDGISISVDGNTVSFPDAQPFIDEKGRTQVPIRAVSEMLDCTVDWNDITKTATVTRENGDTVALTLGSDVMTINGKTTQMDTAAMIKDDRTYIPVRFVAEALGLSVEWID